MLTSPTVAGATTTITMAMASNRSNYNFVQSNSTPSIFMSTTASALGLVLDGNASTTAPLLNGTCGSNNETLKSDFIENEAVQAFFCVLYSSIFILGVFGNALVCYVVFRNKAMQTVTNLFITNLALSDILLCILAVPFTPLYTFLGRWVFGVPLCHIVPYAQGCSVYISTLTLTSIAIDRFFVIIYPFHPRMKLSTCLWIVIFIWLFSLLVTFPYGLYVRITDFNGTRYCEECWPSEKIRKIFGSCTTMLQFVFPFCIMAFAYICVSIRLNDRAKAKPGSKTSKRDEIDRDRKKRTNRMLIAMVAIFGGSWLPLNVVNTINDFEPEINCWRYYNVLFFIAHLTAMSSTCYNPFLYAWLNENFRKEFKQVLPCFDPSRGRLAGGSGGRSFRGERTCNGNNETIQESLLPSAVTSKSALEIKPRDPIKEAGMRASFKTATTPTALSKTTTTSCDTNDTILLSEVYPPPSVQPQLSHQETIVLPSGVLETPFDEAPVGNGGNAVAISSSISSNLLLQSGSASPEQVF